MPANGQRSGKENIEGTTEMENLRKTTGTEAQPTE